MMDHVKKLRLFSLFCDEKITALFVKSFVQPYFYWGSEFVVSSSVQKNRFKKEREISKPGKNQGLESCSNIFSPLDMWTYY